MNPPPGSFQQVFAQALLADVNQGPDWTRQPGFAVYRNTVMKGCIDALEANFPAVARLVGSDWFRSAAALHVAEHPPTDPRLMLYGTAFPRFLQSFGPASELPYLASVARLDRYWTESHVASDSAAADGTWLARYSARELGELRLKPHPAARWAWFPDLPIFSIWSSNRDLPSDRISPAGWTWQAEGALLTRPSQAVMWAPASRGTCAFLDACASGHSLTEAAMQAADAEQDLDLSALLSDLLQRGALQQH